MSRKKTSIKEIIIHCTATPFNKDYHVDDIRRMHKMNGWLDVGYHFIITLDGEIEYGRPLQFEGAHTYGHNKNSIGIAYIGGLGENGFPLDTRTHKQKSALKCLVKMLCKSYPIQRVCGHRDYNSLKACPCFDAGSEYNKYVKLKNYIA